MFSSVFIIYCRRGFLDQKTTLCVITVWLMAWIPCHMEFPKKTSGNYEIRICLNGHFQSCSKVSSSSKTHDKLVSKQSSQLLKTHSVYKNILYLDISFQPQGLERSWTWSPQGLPVPFTPNMFLVLFLWFPAWQCYPGISAGKPTHLIFKAILKVLSSYLS